MKTSGVCSSPWLISLRRQSLLAKLLTAWILSSGPRISLLQRAPSRTIPPLFSGFSLRFTMRSHYCGEINESLNGQEIEVCGWVHRRRDHGGVIFIDLRDREGSVAGRF